MPNDLIYTVFGFLVGLIGIEIISIVIHRYLFHGPLWFLHKSHHTPRRGLWEWNDLFSLGFALLAIFCIWWGLKGHPVVLGLGLGISAYGMLYFAIHDAFVHRRFIPLRFEGRYLQAVRQWHRTHHQKSSKDGQGPYGLFLPY
jgi:beta-carotene 3-hydroxylase